MQKILLMYYSGSGSTKMISEILQTVFNKNSHPSSITLYEINSQSNPNIVNTYDFLIIGVPTYHNSPPNFVLKFIDKFSNQKYQKKAFIFSTYGLYPGNTLRQLAKKLYKKNIFTIGYENYKGPASDGVLMFPSFFKFMFEYEANITKKIIKSLKIINDQTKSNKVVLNIPRFKFYSLLDWIPNKLITKNIFKYMFTPKIRVVPERWKNKKIDSNFPESWDYSEKVPVLKNFKDYEFDLRSVHRTDNKAVIFADWMKNKQRLTPKFYNEKKKLILSKLNK